MFNGLEYILSITNGLFICTDSNCEAAEIHLAVGLSFAAIQLISSVRPHILSFHQVSFTSSLLLYYCKYRIWISIRHWATITLRMKLVFPMVCIGFISHARCDSSNLLFFLFWLSFSTLLFFYNDRTTLWLHILHHCHGYSGVNNEFILSITISALFQHLAV